MRQKIFKVQSPPSWTVNSCLSCCAEGIYTSPVLLWGKKGKGKFWDQWLAGPKICINKNSRVKAKMEWERRRGSGEFPSWSRCELRFVYSEPPPAAVHTAGILLMSEVKQRRCPSHQLLIYSLKLGSVKGYFFQEMLSFKYVSVDHTPGYKNAHPFFCYLLLHFQSRKDGNWHFCLSYSVIRGSDLEQCMMLHFCHYFTYCLLTWHFTFTFYFNLTLCCCKVRLAKLIHRLRKCDV